MKRFDLRFLGIWFGCIGIVAGTIAAFGAGVLAALEEQRRLAVLDALDSLGPLPYLIVIGLAISSGLLAAWIRRAYFEPLEWATEAATLMATVNRDHRVDMAGPAEMQALLKAVNALGDRLMSVGADTDARIAEAKQALELEKNRLAVLMAELPQSVVVCDADGRIMLYNEQARRLFTAEDAPRDGTHAYLGLGRSLYAMLPKPTIEEALRRLSTRIDAGEADPIELLSVALSGGRLLRMRISTLPARYGTGDSSSGFVILLEDRTSEVTGIERRRVVLSDLLNATATSVAGLLPALERIERSSGAESAETLARARQACHDLRSAIQSARAQHEALDRAEVGEPEVVRSADVIALVESAVQQAGMAVNPDAPARSAFHTIRTQDLLQTVRYVAHRLRDEFGIHDVGLRIVLLDDGFAIELAWLGRRLSGATLAAWEDDPLAVGGEASELPLRDLLKRQGAALSHEIDRATGRSGLRLSLAGAGHAAAAQRTHAARPIFYDFELPPAARVDGAAADALLSELTYTAFDTETTGLDPGGGDEIISIGAIRIVNGRMLEGEEFDQLVDTARRIHPEAMKVHNIRPEHLRGQPRLEHVLPRFHAFCEGTVLLGHNIAFDLRFLQIKEASIGVSFRQPVLDTLLLAGVLHDTSDNNSLEAIARRLGIEAVGRHTALGDARLTAEVFLKMIDLLAGRGIRTLAQAQTAAARTRYAKLAY